jgi:hypothetical protein
MMMIMSIAKGIKIIYRTQQFKTKGQKTVFHNKKNSKDST